MPRSATTTCAVFDALRGIVRSGSEWRMLPHDLPPWAAVYQQRQRWLASGAFTVIVHGGPLGSMRVMLRLAAGRVAEPTAANGALPAAGAGRRALAEVAGGAASGGLPFPDGAAGICR